MELKETLLKRRSVRAFSSKEVDDTQINELMHAAMSGPSARNQKPWEFFIIKDKKILNEIKIAHPYANYNGSLAIVVVGDLNRALPGKSSEYWIQDCSAATENILLRATDLGLGTVWCGVYPSEERAKAISKVLNLSKNQIPLNVIIVGYPEKEVDPRDQYEQDRVHIL